MYFRTISKFTYFKTNVYGFESLMKIVFELLDVRNYKLNVTKHHNILSHVNFSQKKYPASVRHKIIKHFFYILYSK